MKLRRVTYENTETYPQINNMSILTESGEWKKTGLAVIHNNSLRVGWDTNGNPLIRHNVWTINKQLPTSLTKATWWETFHRATEVAEEYYLQSLLEQLVEEEE